MSHPLAALPGNQSIIPVNQSTLIGQAGNQSPLIGQAGNQSPLISHNGNQSPLIGHTGNQSGGPWGQVNLLSNPLQSFNQPFQVKYIKKKHFNQGQGSLIIPK